MKLAPNLYRSRWMTRKQEIDEWIDESGRIVLLGEAAHPWYVSRHARSAHSAPLTCAFQPGGTHDAAMAIEDAVVLGTLFSHLSSWAQVPAFLNAYQEIRQKRTAAVLDTDVSNIVMVQLPPGPERDARNAQLRLARDEWGDDGLLKQEFESLAQLFGYDAEDAAQVRCCAVTKNNNLCSSIPRNGG